MAEAGRHSNVEMVSVRTPTCIMCGRTGVLQVPKAGWEKYQKGEFVQKAFPDLTADEREMLITGTHPDCFDKLAPPD